MVDAAREELLGFFGPIGLAHDGLVFLCVRIGRAQTHIGLEDAVAMRKVDRLHRVPLVKTGGEGRQVVKVQRRIALFFLDLLFHTARRYACGLVRHRRVQGVELVFHEELPVRLLHHPVAHRHHLDLAFG